MKKIVLLAAIAASSFGCANNDPYQDSMYTLQRDLRHRNQKWDQAMDRTALRNQARDDRYQAWFNAVMD